MRMHGFFIPSAVGTTHDYIRLALLGANIRFTDDYTDAASMSGSREAMRGYALYMKKRCIKEAEKIIKGFEIDFFRMNSNQTKHPYFPRLDVVS